VWVSSSLYCFFWISETENADLKWMLNLIFIFFGCVCVWCETRYRWRKWLCVGDFIGLSWRCCVVLWHVEVNGRCRPLWWKDDRDWKVEDTTEWKSWKKSGLQLCYVCFKIRLIIRIALGWHRVGWHWWHWSITMSQCLWKREKHKHCDIVIDQCHQCHPTLCHPSVTLIIHCVH